MKTMRLAAIVAMLTVVGTACADSNGASESTEATKPLGASTTDSKTIERDVQIDISGAHEVHIRKRLPVFLLTARNEDPRGALTSVTLKTPLDLGNGKLLLTDIALYGDDAVKPSVQLPAGMGEAPPGAPKVDAPPVRAGQAQSKVQFTLVTSNPVTELLFSYHTEPCQVTLEADGAIGSATCGAAYASTGDRVAFKMTWRP
jgi:hypothetical protein